MGRLPLVLAIEPDLRQAAIVKRIVREKVEADVTVVDSRDAAIDAMRAAMPDVLLVSTLLSPRDEEELIAHLRTLEGAAHLQTHTIPQLASALGPGEGESRGGLLAAFRRKRRGGSAPAGCDPDLFANEIRVFLQLADERKRDAESSMAATLAFPATIQRSAPPTSIEEPAAGEGSSWASPFEWRPADRSVPVARPESAVPQPAPAVASPETAIAGREHSDAAPIEALEPAALPADAPIAGPEALQIEPPVARPQPPTLSAGPEAENSGPTVLEPVPLPVDPEPLPASAGAALATDAIPTPSDSKRPPSRVASPVSRTPSPSDRSTLDRTHTHESLIDGVTRAGTRGLGTDRFAIDRFAIDPFGIDRLGIDRFGIANEGSRIEDEGSRMKDEGSGIDEWRRVVGRLRVPGVIAGVSYAHGCRIRRVRVPPARDAQGARGGALSDEVTGERHGNAGA